MAYQKTTWKDRKVQNPRTYSVRDNGDGTITLLEVPGEITEAGTPVNAANMNKIESGIEAAQLYANLEQEISQSNEKYPSSLAVTKGVGKTNCLTKTPNNIVYEFADNTFKIKANSKVYIPNGNGNFEEVILDKDYIAAILTSSNGKFVVFYRKDKQMFGNMALSQCYSGDGSDVPSGSCMYYDITKNELRYFSSAGEASELFSFPLAILNVENNQVVSVAEVFQWCGYIGRTLFRYGVSGYIPAGRDSNGYALNSNVTINRVNVTTFGKSVSMTNRIITCDSSGNLSESSEFIISNTVPVNKNNTGALWYNPQTNILYRFGSAGMIKWNHLILGYISSNNGTITSFVPKTNFQTLDYLEYAFRMDNIDNIVSTLALKDLSNATVGSITAKIMPDYNAGVSKTTNVEYTATEDCVAIGYDQRTATGGGSAKFLLNGENIRVSTSQDNYATNNFTYFIPKGATYKSETSGVGCEYIVYPLKGAK